MKFSELDLLLQFPFQSKGQAVLVDVGAHAGFVSVKFAQRGWRVIAFEPEPENRKDLQERLKSYKDVTIIQKAVSDKEGELVPFYVSSEHWGIHSFKPFNPTHKTTLTVETVRLDKTLDSLGINHVSLLKIDVEGADFSVLQSFNFEKIKPEIAMCEFADDRSLPNFGCTHHDIAHYMESKGYKVFVSEWAPIKEYGRKGQKSDPHQFLQCVPYPLNHEPAWGNLIFVSNDNITVFKKVLNDYLISCKKEQEQRLIADSYPYKTKTQQLTISVITPSFNQAQFLRDCLDSVAQQTVTPLEHLVYDPGSKDDSQFIIREYAKKYSFIKFFDEPDCGQSDAVSKGMMMAKGDIIGWLNSDDCYASSDVLATVIERFQQPDAPDIIYGRGTYINDKGQYLRDAYVNKDPESLSWRLQKEVGILQPSLFIKRTVVEKIGILSDSLHFCMDYDYWIRAMKAGLKFAFIPKVLAHGRYYKDNKTLGSRGKSLQEICNTVKQHFGYVHIQWIRNYAEFLSEGFDGILKNSGNQEIKNHHCVDTNIRRLLKAYNGDYYTLELLKKHGAQRPYNTTIEAMKKYQISFDFFCKPIPTKQQTQQNCYCYTVGDKRWAFNRKWKDAQIQKTQRAFEKFRSERSQDTCIIVGNGPSLNQADLSLLKNQDVFITNYAFLNAELLENATYIAVTNFLVAEQGSHQFNLLQGIRKLFPYWLGYCLNDDENTFFFNSVGYPEFSTNIHQNVSWRSTVSFFQMQIAYWLGYRKVLLIGFDHSYSQDVAAREGDILVCEEDDRNHFDSRYFKGKRWQAADVTNMEAMYILARRAFEEDGRTIINCTVGGHLEVFPRGYLKSNLFSNVFKNLHTIKNNSVSSGFDIIEEADILIRQKKWDEAVTAYKKAIDINPDQPSFIYEKLGEALMRCEQDILSNVSYTKTTEEKNDSSSSYLKSANFLMKQRKWDEAIDAYKQGLTVNPKQPGFVYESLGEALMSQHQSYPRLLVIDWTKIGAISATGQVKKNLFAEWPEDKLLQVFCKGSKEFGLLFRDDVLIAEEYFADAKNVLQKCDEFKPDLIYYRPVADNIQFHDLACQLIEKLKVPLVTHIMDDWMTNLQDKDPIMYAQLEPSIRYLFKRSSACLSISEAMSRAFQERYDRHFISIMNCIDLDQWFSQRDIINLKESNENKTFVIRYIGALADNMNFSSISDIVNTVSHLHGKQFAVQMEIYTMPCWKQKAISAFSHLPGIKIKESNLSQHDYRKLLMTANMLVVAYNFDRESINYIRYSIANKFPECLASGAPTLVYGPSEVATVSYAASTNAVQLVSEQNINQLSLAITKLMQNPTLCKELGQKGREFILKYHNAELVRDKFYSILKKAAINQV